MLKKSVGEGKEYSSAKLDLPPVAENGTEEPAAVTFAKLKKQEFVLHRSPAVTFLWRFVEGWPVEFVTDNVEEVLGYTAEDFLSGCVSWVKITYPEDVPRLEAEIAQFLQEGVKEWEQEYRLITKSGEVRWFEDRNIFIKDSEGVITHIQGIILDITKRKRIEEELRESERKYREIASSIPGVVYQFVMRKDGSYYSPFMSEGASSILGISPQEVMNDPNSIFDRIVKEDRGYIDRSIIESARTMDPWSQQFRVRLKTGEVRWIRGSSIPHRLPNEDVLWNGVLYDITDHERAREILQSEHNDLERRVSERTIEIAKANEELQEEIKERKQAEAALRASEKKYRELVENLNDIIYQTDENAVVTYVSPNVETIGGYKQSEIIGKKFTDFVFQEDLEGRMKKFKEMMSGGNEPTEYRYATKFGQYVWIRTTAKPIIESNRVIGVQGVLTDITKRKQAEEALLEAQANLKRHRDKLEEMIEQRTRELEEKNKELSVQAQKLGEMNSALRVLLDQRETDKEEFVKVLIQNLRTLVIPYLEQLKGRQHSAKLNANLEIAISNLQDILFSFGSTLASRYSNLTPREIQVASLIRDGKSTKEIAQLFNLSTRSIEYHRENIRKKLRLINKKVNLRSHLFSLK
ncbi:MAG: PAS domain-containing protein [Deltaproteobacteria bacterium]|nr:PAS domain-containing protein [Deltaproteobacteria bacterium]MBW2053038.1 PAS domain-containing protein [Deltaproteobacteria bacterium]MBW2141665.1 PAS domain-containing protein [Deltaproteobacteria bacterium]MBW2323183.1 PAS domain-containing protein [Deltaproteobacteria bacterium]